MQLHMRTVILIEGQFYREDSRNGGHGGLKKLAQTGYQLSSNIV
jgi:hypothetical protein